MGLEIEPAFVYVYVVVVVVVVVVDVLQYAGTMSPGHIHGPITVLRTFRQEMALLEYLVDTTVKVSNSSVRSMEVVRFRAPKGNYDRQAVHPTDRPTDGHEGP